MKRRRGPSHVAPVQRVCHGLGGSAEVTVLSKQFAQAAESGFAG